MSNEPPRDVILRWDVTNGDTMGAEILCRSCHGEPRRCDECDGSGVVHRPYELAAYLASLTFTPVAAPAASPEQPERDQLPDGVYRWEGKLCVPDHLPVPAGWREVHRTGRWALVEPMPDSVLVPWWEAVRNARTVVVELGPGFADDTFVAATAFFDSAERFCIGTDAHDADINLEVPEDGLVAVLPHPENGGER